jgi:hypothetical protein
MALNFPSSPTIGQIYTDSVSGFSYEWNGTVWISFSAASSSQIKPLDDISGSFDDVTQTFALTSNSVSITPPTAQSLIINLGGVIQDATDDYSVTSSNITFSTPPASGLSFSGVSLGPAVPVDYANNGNVYTRTTFTATASQTTFTVTGSYTVGYLDVYQNGVRLSAGTDYTATNGTTFVLTTPAILNDEIESIGYKVATVVTTIGEFNNLNVLGISTFTNGPVFIGAATSTGTGTATQRLQVTGGAYVSGNLGIGTTNPTHKLHVLGDVRITGILTVGTGSITLDGSTNTISGITTINTTSINGGPLAGFRNAIINGNFDIWQRGTSFTLLDYGADRWIHARVGTTQTATRQSFTVGQTDVPGEPTYYCQTVVSSVAGAGNFCNLIQRIEDVRTFAGQQVTISFWAKADATKNIAVDLAQTFGSGGSPSAAVVGIGVTKVSIGTSWQKVTVTANVPSISGKTLGSNNGHTLILSIFFDAGSDANARTDSLGQQSGTFDIAQVQVEPGPVATPFERRPIGTELALCQRYFWSSSTAQGYPIGSGQAFGASTAGYVVALPVPMRSIFVTAGANNLYATSAGGGNVLFNTVVGVLVADTSKLYISLGGASSLTAGHGSLLLIGTAGVNGSLSLSAEL